MPPVDLPVEVVNLWTSGHIQLGGVPEADSFDYTVYPIWFGNTLG